MTPKTEWGEILMAGCNPSTGQAINKVIPTWTCGHCSEIHVMDDYLNNRPTTACVYCVRWICPTKPICQQRCTPLHSLANDRFENSKEWGILVPEIMVGKTDSEIGK